MKRKINSKLETVTVGSVTVKIYIRNRVRFGKIYLLYEVADFTSGKRRLRSFADHDGAVKEAERIARQLSTGEAMAASLTNGEAAAYGHATEILRPIKANLLTAVTRYAEAVKILGSDRIIEAVKDFVRRNPVKREARTVRQVVDELLKLKISRKASTRYVEDLRSRLTKFSEKFAVNIDTITTADIQGWLNSMKASPRTIRNCRNNASSLFKFAERCGYIARGENPVTATDRIKVKNTDAIEIFSPVELARLLAAAPDSYKPILAIQAFAGLRSAEVMRLDWQDVKLDRGHIEVTAAKAKTASRRIVPISPNLAAWLKPHIKKSGKLFPHSVAYFHELQQTIATRTAKDDLPAVPWKHNALRHSFISYRVAEIQNVAQVALEAGNSPNMIFGHYRELVTREDANLWFAIAPESAPVSTPRPVRNVALDHSFARN